VKVRVALAQIVCPKGEWEHNLRHAAEYMAQAAAQGCDIIVFPEMSLSGYGTPDKFPDLPTSLDSPWIERFAALTAEHGIAASAGFIEASPGGKPFITQVLAQDGRVVGVYRKVNLGEGEPELYQPGSDAPVFPLHTREGEVTCALAICADDDGPQLFADYARQGAQVVFHSSAPGLYGRRTDEQSWRNGYNWYKGRLAERLPLYAREHSLPIAVATQCGTTVDEDFPGGSYVFGADGACLAGTADWQEALLIYDMEIDGRDARAYATTQG
jgi:predicted amidohydrolase